MKKESPYLFAVYVLTSNSKPIAIFFGERLMIGKSIDQQGKGKTKVKYCFRYCFPAISVRPNISWKGNNTATGDQGIMNSAGQFHASFLSYKQFPSDPTSNKGFKFDKRFHSIKRKTKTLLSPAPTSKISLLFITSIITDPDIHRPPFTTCWTTELSRDGRNCSYPNDIWWACTQVYPDGVVCVLNSAPIILSGYSQQCCEWKLDPLSQRNNLVEAKTLCCWNKTTVFCYSFFALKTEWESMYNSPDPIDAPGLRRCCSLFCCRSLLRFRCCSWSGGGPIRRGLIIDPGHFLLLLLQSASIADAADRSSTVFVVAAGFKLRRIDWSVLLIGLLQFASMNSWSFHYCCFCCWLIHCCCCNCCYWCCYWSWTMTDRSTNRLTLLISSLLSVPAKRKE